MLWLWISLGVIGGSWIVVLLIALICFLRVFYSPSRKPMGEDNFPLPSGACYEPFHDAMVEWIKTARNTPHEHMSITSTDGLTLNARYYECRAGAIVELLFHGYRGSGERDISAAIERCFALGRNALIVDQRASGTSDGHVITFGIREADDCRCWVDHAIRRFGKDVRIVLSGVSMGAATVMMAAGEQLPENVVCVLADCGYSSPREIICKVIRDMKLPPRLLYPFIRLGARLYGGFDPEENSPLEALARATVPVILIHGDTDDFVPHEMSERLHAVCASRKKLVTIHGAGHGIAYPVDKQRYLDALSDFQRECGF